MSLDSPPRGLLLDMDGTLVDSERVWFEAERAAVARLGGSLPAEAGALTAPPRPTPHLLPSPHP